MEREDRVADNGLENENQPPAGSGRPTETLYDLIKRMRAVLKSGSLYDDFRQGIRTMQNWMSHAPEDAFYVVEGIRLRYRLTRIQKKLFDAYSILGTQVIDHSTGNLVSEEERDQVYQQITGLREKQKRIEAEGEELKSSRTSQKEQEEKI